jgi:hypothetical protein
MYIVWELSSYSGEVVDVGLLRTNAVWTSQQIIPTPKLEAVCSSESLEHTSPHSIPIHNTNIDIDVVD